MMRNAGVRLLLLLALVALPSCGAVAVIGAATLIGIGVSNDDGGGPTEFAGVPFGFIRGPDRFTVEIAARLEFLSLPGTVLRGRVEHRRAGDTDWKDWGGDEREGFFPLSGIEREWIELSGLELGRYRFTLEVATGSENASVFTDIHEWNVVSVLPFDGPRNLRASLAGDAIALAWDPPPYKENVFVAGYRVYYGPRREMVAIGGVVGGTPPPGEVEEAFLPVGGTGAIVSGGERDSPALVGSVLTTTLVNLDPCAEHFFAVTAIDAAGVESRPTGVLALRSHCGPQDPRDTPSDPDPDTESPPPPFSGLAEPEAIVTGDFNHDGQVELAVAEKDGGRVRIISRDPAGRGFAQGSAQVAVGPRPVWILKVDLDEDALTDLLVAHEEGGVVSLRGLDGGAFRAETSNLEDASFDLHPSLLAGDFDADSVIDVIAVEDASGILRGSFGEPAPPPGGPNDVNGRSGFGSGTFRPAVNLIEVGHVVDSTMADFDGDGHLDVALSDAFDPVVLILRGDGVGGLDAPIAVPVSGLPGALVAADFDSDGVTDLAVANREPLGQVSILIGTAHAIDFRRAGDHPVGTSPSALVAADLDQDGALDLVVANRGSDDVSFLFGIADGLLGSGEFRSQLRRGAGAGPADLVVVDWDGDKLLDVITADSSAGTVTLLLGTGTMLEAEGTFRLNREQLDRFEQLSEGPIEDGDLAEFEALDAQVRHFMFDEPEGAERPTPESPRIDTLDEPVAMVQGDFNGDGIPDLAVLLEPASEAIERPPAVAIYRGTGVDAVGTLTAPSFGDPVVFSLGTPAYGSGLSLVTGDVDGDGIADLAVGRGSEALTLLRGIGSRGRGDGIFEAPALAGVFAHLPSNLVAVDLDGDAVLDLVYGDGPDSKVQSMLGDGDGWFIPETPASVNPRVDCGTSQRHPVVVADFNADGALDYASVADLGSDLSPRPPDSELPNPCGQVHLLLGRTEEAETRFVYSDQGDGLSIIDLGSQTSDIVTADFNGDGILDLAVSDRDQNRVNVLLGDGSDGHGNGRFVDGTDVAVGRGPEALIAFDLNQDGWIDLATANLVDGSVSVLLGDGSGNFAPFTDGRGGTLRDYWVGGEPIALLIGDYNRDTLPDLVVAVRGERGLRVLLGAPR